MNKSTSEIITLAGLGVSLIIDASTKSTSEIITIVGAAGRKGGHIILKNSSKKSTSELISICSVYPGNVTLDLS